MPLAPYAKLRASINGASVVTGGITCAGGESIALSADPAGALTSFKIEIYDYPPEFALPSGWTSAVDATGATVYLCTPSNGIAPTFTLDSAAHWWKYMFRLTGNNGDNGGNKNIPASQLIDEKTAITVPAASGIQQIGRNETTQFNPDWNTTVQKNLRIVDAIAGATVNASALAPAQLVDIANVASLSGEQTIDGVLTSVSRVLLVGQTTSSQNGPWLTAPGAWSRPADFNSDAKVIAGQTVFITAGATQASTTWQLKTGSTLAGAKVYGQVVAPTISPPNDLVDTSSLTSLSGEQTIDGTLTSASRVLLVNQTTTSQNGPWVTGAGAWARPTDFATDGHVVAGSFFYVKSGTLGSNTTWQMTSGSSLAGTKTFVRSLNGASRPAVRVVQTAALPTNSYSSGVITGTAALSTAFDGIGPSTTPPLLVGDRVLVVLEGTKNGIYTVTSMGGSAYVLTRALDLNVSAHFAGGVQVDVLDGATTISNFKGTRWAMTTLGVVTLDSTNTTWAQVVARDLRELDITNAQYGLVPATSSGGLSGFGDQALIINQAIADAFALGIGRVRLPVGWIRQNSPIVLREGIKLIGAGEFATHISAFHAGGPQICVQRLDAFPASATVVDSTANRSLVFALQVAKNNYWLNFTRAGMWIDAWAGFSFECDFTYTDSGGAGGGHIIGCGGRQHLGETLTKCFELKTVGGFIVGDLRVGGTNHRQTHSLALTAGHTYYVALDYDGTTIRLHVADMSAAAASTLVSTAASGTVNQKPWEETHLGCGSYDYFPEQGSYSDPSGNGGMFTGLFGCCFFRNVSNGRTAAFTPSHVVTPVNFRLFFSPDTSKLWTQPANVAASPTTNGPQGYQVALSGGPGFAPWRRVGAAGNLQAIHNVSVEGVDLFHSGANMVSGVHAWSAAVCDFRHIQTNGSFDGIVLGNNSFESSLENIVVSQTTNGIGIGFCGASGLCTMHELMVFGSVDSGGTGRYCYPLVDVNSGIHQTGKCYLIPGNAQLFALFNKSFSTYDNLVCSSENSDETNLPQGVVLVNPGNGGFLSIRGNIEGSFIACPPFIVGGISSEFPGTWSFSGQLSAKTGAPAYISYVASDLPRVRLGQIQFTGPLAMPLCDTANKVTLWGGGGSDPDGAVLTDANTTCTVEQGHVRSMAAGVLTTARTITPSAGGVTVPGFESQELQFNWEPQAFSLAFVDSGPGTPTIFTARPGTKGSLVVRLNNAGNWVKRLLSKDSAITRILQGSAASPINSAIGDTNIFASAPPQDLLRVSIYLAVKTAATLGTATINIKYKDDTGTTITRALGPYSLASAPAEFDTSVLCETDGVANVTYGVVFNTVTVGPLAYTLRVVAEEI